MTVSGGDSRENATGKGSYSCCAGLTLFNKAMQEQGKLPTCLGVRHIKDGNLKADRSQQLPSNSSNYQFACLGYSVHSRFGPGSDTIPYCEGVELVSFAENTDTAAQPNGKTTAAAAVAVDAVAASDAVPRLPPAGKAKLHAPPHESLIKRAFFSEHSPADTGAASHRPFSQRFMEGAKKNVDIMQATLRNEGSIKVRSFPTTKDLSTRLWQVGGQNVSKLQAGISRTSAFISDKAGAAWQAMASSVSGSRERAGES